MVPVKSFWLIYRFLCKNISLSCLGRDDLNCIEEKVCYIVGVSL